MIQMVENVQRNGIYIFFIFWLYQHIHKPHLIEERKDDNGQIVQVAASLELFFCEPNSTLLHFQNSMELGLKFFTIFNALIFKVFLHF